MSNLPRQESGSGRETLIESHLPLVRSVARRYIGLGEPLDDLVQVGALGLVKASGRFDPARGTSFASFATPAIEGEIRRHLGDRAPPMRLPRELQRITGELRRQRTLLAVSLGRQPAVEELAAAVGVAPENIERALEAEQLREAVSISEHDELVAEEESHSDSEERMLLSESLRALDERERRIVFLRFHADLTEREIARAVGLSQSQVSRLIASALAKLKGHLESEGDIASTGAISGSSGEQKSTKSPDLSRFASRIAPVVGSHQRGDIERYLALPYSVSVRPTAEPGRAEWVASVEELPGCEARGATRGAAVERLKPAMEQWLAAALAEGRAIPRPARRAAKRKEAPGYSGRLLVRMPSELHEELALAAERQQVSLNRLITDALAASVADDAPAAPGGDGVGPADRRELSDMVGADRARAFKLALTTNLIVVVLAGVAAVALLILAVTRGI